MHAPREAKALDRHRHSGVVIMRESAAPTSRCAGLGRVGRSVRVFVGCIDRKSQFWGSGSDTLFQVIMMSR